MRYKVSDWVRLMRGGILVLTEIKYVLPHDTWTDDEDIKYMTEIGPYKGEDFIEVRRKAISTPKIVGIT